MNPEKRPKMGLALLERALDVINASKKTEPLDAWISKKKQEGQAKARIDDVNRQFNSYLK